MNAATSEEDVLAGLQQRYGEEAEAVLAAFKAAYPHEATVNALYTDTMIRTPILRITAHKADQGGAIMILGAHPELVYHHDIELLSLLEPGFAY